MGDNKVNMSLDDIIKLNKKSKTSIPKKGVRGNARNGGATSKGKKFGTPRKGTAVARSRMQSAAVKNSGVTRKGKGVVTANAQTKKLVSQLVKKALRQRLGGSLAARRSALATTGTRVQRGNIGRVAARSRIIARNRTVVTRTIPAVARQHRRGFASNTLYQDEIVTPVIVRRQPVVRQRPSARPVVHVQRVIQAHQPRVVQRFVRRPRSQRVIVQQQPVRQRVIQPRQRRVFVVERQAPVQRVQKVIQRVQRPQIVRQRPQQRNIQYVQAKTKKNNVFHNTTRFNRNQQVVQRFEPVNTFISRKVVRRGRGFNI